MKTLLSNQNVATTLANDATNDANDANDATRHVARLTIRISIHGHGR